MKALFILLSFFLTSCSNNGKEEPFSVGVDASFSSIQVGEKGDYLEGYVSEFLRGFSKRSGKTLAKVEVDAKNLLEGLYQDKYQAVISTLSPYNFNLAKYDFSESLLEVGKVLVVAKDVKISTLQEMEKPVIGIHEEELSGQISALLPKDTVVKKYASYPELLDALVDKEIKGAILFRLLALSFAENNYFEKIKVLKEPLTKESLRVITLKGKEASFLRHMNEFLSKKREQKKLQKKWKLA